MNTAAQDLQGATAEYLAWIENVRGYTPATRQSYGSTFRQLCLWWGDRAGWPDVQDLEVFVNRKRGTGTNGFYEPAAATVARDVVSIRSLYTWAERQGYVVNGTDVLFAPKLRGAQPKALADETWQALWNWPFLDVEDRVWLGLGYFCGLRCAELRTVQTHHVQLVGRKLVGFKRKGGGDHTVPVGTILDVIEQKLPHLHPELLWPALEAVQGGGGALAPFTTNQQLSRKLDRLIRFTDVERFTPHALRHSAVTNLLRAGVPLHLVAKLMNHTNVSTTMRYVRAGGDELSEWLTGS